MDVMSIIRGFDLYLIMKAKLQYFLLKSSPINIRITRSGTVIKGQHCYHEVTSVVASTRNKWNGREDLTNNINHVDKPC